MSSVNATENETLVRRTQLGAWIEGTISTVGVCPDWPDPSIAETLTYVEVLGQLPLQMTPTGVNGIVGRGGRRRQQAAMNLDRP